MLIKSPLNILANPPSAMSGSGILPNTGTSPNEETEMNRSNVTKTESFLQGKGKPRNTLREGGKDPNLNSKLHQACRFQNLKCLATTHNLFFFNQGNRMSDEVLKLYFYLFHMKFICNHWKVDRWFLEIDDICIINYYSVFTLHLSDQDLTDQV